MLSGRLALFSFRFCFCFTNSRLKSTLSISKKFCSEFRVSSDNHSKFINYLIHEFWNPWRKSLLFCMVVVQMVFACLKKFLFFFLRMDQKYTLHLSIFVNSLYLDRKSIGFTGRVGIAEAFRKLIACRPISRSCTSSDKVRP